MLERFMFMSIAVKFELTVRLYFSYDLRDSRVVVGSYAVHLFSYDCLSYTSSVKSNSWCSSQQIQRVLGGNEQINWQHLCEFICVPISALCLESRATVLRLLLCVMNFIVVMIIVEKHERAGYQWGGGIAPFPVPHPKWRSSTKWWRGNSNIYHSWTKYALDTGNAYVLYYDQLLNYVH